METDNLKQHWENIYRTKKPGEVSWTQAVPTISLDLIRELQLPKTAKVMDAGAGESRLPDFLLDDGFENISVMDISAAALNKMKERLAGKADGINFIVSDVTEYVPDRKFDLWHDRAVFHFLTEEEKIQKYLEIIKSSLHPGGYLILGTFSTNGPKKCSGLSIVQYSEESMIQKLGTGFEHLKTVYDDHTTPFNTKQNFIFGVFRKR